MANRVELRYGSQIYHITCNLTVYLQCMSTPYTATSFLEIASASYIRSFLALYCAYTAVTLSSLLYPLLLSLRSDELLCKSTAARNDGIEVCRLNVE